MMSGTHNRMRARWESLLQDLRFGLRTLRKSPGFTAVAILTLALGIGANTAIFSVVEAVLLRPLPFREPARLTYLTESLTGKVENAGVPYPDYLVWRSKNHVFDEIAAYWKTGDVDDLVLGGPSSVERVQYSVVTNSFFPLLGVTPSLGRGFTDADEQVSGPKIFLASNALWRRVFAARTDAIGQTFLLDGEPWTLAGVMPVSFGYPSGCDVWVPVSAIGAHGVVDRISHPFWVLGRLKSGVSVAQAAADVNVIQAQLAQEFPGTDAGWRANVHPLRDEFVGGLQTSLLVLFGATFFILLIACANVVNLMMARASTRAREYALRGALGAGRARLAQQALTECLLIATASAALAVAFAELGMRALVVLRVAPSLRVDAFHISAPVLGFSAFVALLTIVLVGIAPALQLSGVNFRASLANGGRTGTRLQTRRLHSALVISEVALTLALLCGAGLMVKSLYELGKVDPGFRPEHLVTMKIAIPGAQHPRGEQTVAFFDRLLEKLQASPAIRSAAIASTVPLSGESSWETFSPAGVPASWAQAPAAELRTVSPNYFALLGIPLQRGRELTAQDQRSPNDVVVINQAMAQKFWPGMDAIGQHLTTIDDRGKTREIVGIVGDIKSFGLEADNPAEMYVPYRAAWYTSVIVRSELTPAAVLSAVSAEVAALDRSIVVYSASTMDQLLSNSSAPRRFNLVLLALFAGLALVLACVGIYSVLSFAVGARRHEIGVRVALGALPGQILQLIVWQGMRLVLAGMVAGIAASFALSRIVARLLFGVSSTDASTFVAVTALLAVVAFAACCIPARRAMRVDPMVALRHE